MEILDHSRRCWYWLKLKGADVPASRMRLAKCFFVIVGLALLLYSQRGFRWWQLLSKHKESVAIVEFALGAVAVILAIQHALHLEKITKSVSTRFIGSFPDHLDEIRSLVDDSVQRIQILVDAVDYGSFFRPSGHERLFQALRTARKREVDVHILVCGRPQPLSHASYSGGMHLTNLKGNIEFETTLNIYLHELRKDKPFEGELPALLRDVLEGQAYETLIESDTPPTQEGLTKLVNGNIDWNKDAEFMALLLCRHEWFAQRLRSDGVRIDIDWKGDQLEHFVWLRDGTEAVFLFSSAGGDKQKLAFRTHDPTLVMTFERIFEKRYDEFTKRRSSNLIVLRPATTTGDETFVNDLLYTTMSRYVEATWPGDTVAQRNYYDTNKCNLSNTRIVQLQGKDIGRLSTTLRKADCIFVDELHLLPEYQRQGIGTKLIAQVLKEAGENGLPVKLTVLTVNLSAACLYRRLGFTVTEEKDHRLHMQSAQ